MYDYPSFNMASIPEFTDKEKCSFMEMDKISLDQNPSSKFLEADKNPELKFSTLYKYLVHKVQSCDCNQNKDFFSYKNPTSRYSSLIHLRKILCLLLKIGKSKK